jgi:Holliday junction resolvase-like predicted endonuclease
MGKIANTSDSLTFDKVWLMFQETDKKFKDTDKKLNKLEHLFTSQWGKLIESLVEGDLVNLLRKRGINVVSTTQRSKVFFKDKQYEFDIIAENGDEIVIVEVKTTLRLDDVKDFLAKMSEIKQIFPKFKDNKIYGALAFLTEDVGCSTFASKNGLFTIKATGNSASITNSKSFKPKSF